MSASRVLAAIVFSVSLANPTNFTKMGLWTLGGGVQSSSQSSSSSSSDNANGGNKVYGPNGSQGGSNNSRGSSNGSKNPIAGMLQRELGISAQQGRKILDQRQKIQNVCSNLKEVRQRYTIVSFCWYLS